MQSIASEVTDEREIPEDVAAAWATVLLDIHDKTTEETKTDSANDTEAKACDERSPAKQS